MRTAGRARSAAVARLRRAHPHARGSAAVASAGVGGGGGRTVDVNGTSYRVPEGPAPPLVAVCLDGSAQEYFDAAIAAGAMPRLAAMVEGGRGRFGLATAAMPTYTNPNNVAIVCGAPPSVTGVSGNYFYDAASGEEVMMNDASFLRCGTVLSRLSREGVRVRVVTAKHKLLGLLTDGLDPATSFGFSAERAGTEEGRAALAAHGVDALDLMGGREAPGIYDPDISVYTIEAGLRMIERDAAAGDMSPALYYLSTTDFVQHKSAPGDALANEFYGKVDAVLGGLVDAGALVALTADHGMNDKVNFDGSPRVVFAEEVLLGAGIACRVVLPITDPYVVHHGALGSYATVYVDDASRTGEAMALLRRQEGVYSVLDRNEACRNFDLPPDRVGDIVIVGDESTTIGRSAAHHDLTQVPHLRSHGGMAEATVPMIFACDLTHDYYRRLTRGQARNYHVLDFLLNGASPLPPATK